MNISQADVAARFVAAQAVTSEPQPSQAVRQEAIMPVSAQNRCILWPGDVWWHYWIWVIVAFLTILPLYWRMWGWTMAMVLIVVASVLAALQKNKGVIDLKRIVSSWWAVKLFYVLTWLTAFIIYLDYTTGGAP